MVCVHVRIQFPQCFESTKMKSIETKKKKMYDSTTHDGSSFASCFNKLVAIQRQIYLAKNMLNRTIIEIFVHQNMVIKIKCSKNGFASCFSAQRHFIGHTTFAIKMWRKKKYNNVTSTLKLPIV